jgi:biopolymer transport protein ExbB
MLGSSSLIVTVTLWILIGFSVMTWALIILKGRLQWRLARINRRFRGEFWSAHDLGQAETIAAGGDGPLARVGQAGFRALRDLSREGEHSLQFTGEKQDVLESGLRQQIQNEQNEFENGLMILASIGSTAPFVGLFGTVWGIMHALQEIGNTGSATLDVVAGPIGEALIATAIGIATAVPAVLAYNYGVRRARLNVGELETFATDFLRVAVKSSLNAKRGK